MSFPEVSRQPSRVAQESFQFNNVGENAGNIAPGIPRAQSFDDFRQPPVLNLSKAEIISSSSSPRISNTSAETATAISLASNSSDEPRSLDAKQRSITPEITADFASSPTPVAQQTAVAVSVKPAAVSTTSLPNSFWVPPSAHWAPKGSIWDSDLVVNKKGELIQLLDGRGAIAVKNGRARAVTSEDFGFGRKEAETLANNLGMFSCPDKFSADGEPNLGAGVKKGTETRVVANKDRVALANKYRKTYGLDFPASGLSHHMGWVEADYVNDSGKPKTCAGVLHAFILPKDLQPIAKGTVFLLHGLLGHTGFLPNMIKDLISNGYNVVSLDWPGHGLSIDGKRATMDSFEAYQAVLEKSMEAIKPMLDGKPLHMVTHSTGGAIGLDYMSKPRDINRFPAVNGGMVNIAPLFYPAVPKGIANFTTGFSRFWAALTRKDRTLKPHGLGNTRFLKIANDPIGNHPERRDIALARDRRMTTKWQKAWSVWIDKMRGREAAEQKPDGSRIKILGAAQDKIVNTQAGEKHYPRILSGLQHHVISHSCHAMHMDKNTYQGVMTDVIRHLNQHQQIEPIYSQINPKTRTKNAVDQTPEVPERKYGIATKLSALLSKAETSEACDEVADACDKQLKSSGLSAEDRARINVILKAAEEKSNILYKG